VERQAAATARLRAAFTGGVAEGVDVMTLAAQLSSQGGAKLADELVADPVDPTAFLAEATELLDRVQQQQSQLEAFLQAQQADNGDQADAGSAKEQEAVQAALQAEQLLEQRQAAAALVQESIQLAQQVMRSMV
jgi:hypothetical protein